MKHFDASYYWNEHDWISLSLKMSDRWSYQSLEKNKTTNSHNAPKIKEAKLWNSTRQRIAIAYVMHILNQNSIFSLLFLHECDAYSCSVFSIFLSFSQFFSPFLSLVAYSAYFVFSFSLPLAFISLFSHQLCCLFVSCMHALSLFFELNSTRFISELLMCEVRLFV